MAGRAASCPLKVHSDAQSPTLGAVAVVMQLLLDGRLENPTILRAQREALCHGAQKLPVRQYAGGAHDSAILYSFVETPGVRAGSVSLLGQRHYYSADA